MIIVLFLIIFVSMAKKSEGNHITALVTIENSTNIYYLKDTPVVTVHIVSPISPNTKRAWCSDNNLNIVKGTRAENEGIGAVGKNLNASDVMHFKISKPKNSTWFCKFTGYSKEHTHIQGYNTITIVIYDTHFSTNDIGSTNVTSTATDVTATTANVPTTAANVTSTATNVTYTVTIVTSTITNVTSTITNVTSTATNVTSTATNVTSAATNVTFTATNRIDMKRDADILQPSMSPSELVNVIFVGSALLVIGLLVCGLLYYRKQVKMNVIPDSIKSRAPMELPPEVIYETAYSHITGYQTRMKRQQNDITGYQHLMEKQ